MLQVLSLAARISIDRKFHGKLAFVLPIQVDRDKKKSGEKVAKVLNEVSKLQKLLNNLIGEEKGG